MIEDEHFFAPSTCESHDFWFCVRDEVFTISELVTRLEVDEAVGISRVTL